MRQLRGNAHSIHIFNSGPVIFVYDEANGPAIGDANPSLLTGYHADEATDLDAPLLRLGESGKLVVFELYQDDELGAELSLGPPFADGEVDELAYSEPRKARLSLPSGALRIESYDSLTLGGAEPGDEGAQVMLPPGEYVLSVQHLATEFEQDPDEPLPQYYLTLQPAAPAAGEPQAGPPFLRYPRAG
jgi:hypothetical protein